jgi:phage baseplate assembly protein W
MATIKRTNHFFRDFDLAFSAHPNTKDLAVKKNGEAIKQSLRNLLLTQYFERPFHSEIGSPIKGLLFELSTPILRQTLQRGIIDTIQNFEPRVNLEDVNVIVSDDNNEVNVTVIYTIVGINVLDQLDLTLERTR